MPLTSSGQISLNDIATEFGGSQPHQLSEYYGKGNAPGSGEIQIAADFYGTANTYNVEYVVVAGGGGSAGGTNNSHGYGAGGAGGYRTATATLTAGSSGMTVTIGGSAPGTGMIPSNNNYSGASNGGNSSFNGTSSTGGGGGGFRRNGNSGGSGGGGGFYSGDYRGRGWANYSGGGGNAGGYSPSEGNAGSGTSGQQWGRGGDGGQLPVSDRTWLNGTAYAEQGQCTGSGASGPANTGKGANSRRQQYGGGHNGGTGVVIIRYAGAQRGSGGSVSSSGGYTYHQFNSSGTYSP